MVSTSEPHNDYFSCELLLSFPVAGQHTVYVDCAVLDENGVMWRTGPKMSITVKSYDEAAHRQQQQQYAAAKQQQRAQALAHF